MIFNFFLGLILFLFLNIPITGNSSGYLVLAQEEETIDEEDVETEEEEDSEEVSGKVENHLLIRKKKNIKKSQNAEPTFPKHVHTTKGADSDIILELDETNF